MKAIRKMYGKLRAPYRQNRWVNFCVDIAEFANIVEFFHFQNSISKFSLLNFYLIAFSRVFDSMHFRD